MKFRRNRRVRRYRKKRFTLRRRSRFRRRGNKWDGAICSKCIWSYEVPVNGAANGGDVTIMWANDNNVGAANPVLRLDDSLEFLDLYAAYRQYRVEGLKIEFEPTRWLMSTTDVKFDGIDCASELEQRIDSGYTLNAMMSLSTFSHKPYGKFKRYYHVGRTIAKMNRGSGWYDNGLRNLPDCSTYIKILSNGLPATTFLGRLTCTWYVRFRGFHI